MKLGHAESEDSDINSEDEDNDEEYDESEVNVMDDLLALRNNEDEIAEKLLDYSSIDKHVYKQFIDIAFVSCSQKTFVHDMTFIPDRNISNSVTVAEEAFAILIFENNVSRWIFLAQDPREGELPPLKFQKKVKKVSNAKRNKNAAGEWNDEGMDRFNNIVDLIEKKRGEVGRLEFEKDIKVMYEENDVDDSISPRKRKRVERMERKEREDQIVVRNTFDISLCN